MNEEHRTDGDSPASPVRSLANIELIKSRLHGLANTLAGIQTGAEMLEGAPSEPVEAIRAATLEARAELQSISALLQGSGGRSEYFDVREQVELVLQLLRRAIPGNVTTEIRAPDSVLANAPLHDFQVAAAAALLLGLRQLPEGGTLPIVIAKPGDEVTVEFTGAPQIRLPAS